MIYFFCQTLFFAW